MNTIARLATVFAVVAAFFAGCEIAARAPWCWPGAEAGAAVILAATSAWIRHTTSPTTTERRNGRDRN